MKIESFKIAGISVQTTNDNGKAAQDLGNLWSRFFVENLVEKIPNKVSNEIFSIYTDYESDFTGKYTAIIGIKVASIENLPDGLIGREFESGDFVKFVAKGEMPNAVVEIWKEVWSKDEELNRKYSYDFEVYGEKSKNGENSEVEIFIAVN